MGEEVVEYGGDVGVVGVEEEVEGSGGHCWG